MFRIIILLLIVAAVAGYFTRPPQAALETAANNELNILENLGSNTPLGERVFSDYYVATRYVVTLNNETLVECWGAFQQTMCSRPAAE